MERIFLSCLSLSLAEKWNQHNWLAVARKIAGVWEEIASQLSPELFSIVKLKEIERDYRGACFQARAMPEMWSEECCSEATCRLLIDSLCQMGQRAVSAEVFSSVIVDLVEPPCK